MDTLKEELIAPKELREITHTFIKLPICAI